MMKGAKKERISNESAPSMKLCLGIGSDHDHDLDDSRHVFPRLTEAQLNELRQQSLIFNYIAAGLPVPLHLVIPIWNSVASSFGSSIGGADLYRQFPSFVGLSSQGFDYKHMMDPEPGRCRRTDGKKWRCGKDVVPGKKYCERHMHRGQQRCSRKPVEASQTAAASDKKPPNNLIKNSENPNSSNLDQGNTQCKTPCSSYPYISSSPSTICSNLDLKITSISMATTANTDYKNTLVNMNTSTITGYENTPVPMIASAVQADTTTSRATIINNKSSSSSINLKGHYIDDGNCNCSNSVSYEGIIHRSSKGRKMKNFGSNISRGLNFSPKSVLQVQGCGTLRLYKNDVELEPGRCKRTDGKKWRCRRDVVTNNKYCEMHMHRGRKKQADPAAIHDVPSSACLRSTAIYPSSATCRDLNTDLSISIPASPPLILANDDTSTTSNSTDTTISDTIIGSYQN